MPDGPVSAVAPSTAAAMMGSDQSSACKVSTYIFDDRRRRRVVAADQKSDHGRVVSQQSRLARHRGCSHLLVSSVPRLAARLGPRFPFVAALPAGEDHDAVAVGEVVEACVLQLALAADGVEPEVHDVTELGLHALGVVTQEHVRRPASRRESGHGLPLMTNWV